MIAKPIATSLNEEIETTSKIVREATYLGLAIALIAFLFLPNLYPLARIGLIPLSIALSYISTALWQAKRQQPIWELGLIGQGLGMLGVLLFLISAVL